MKDKERIVYMISKSENELPSGIAFNKESDARDSAIRFAEHEKRPYYVHEVAIVYNTLYAIGSDLKQEGR